MMYICSMFTTKVWRYEYLGILTICKATRILHGNCLSLQGNWKQWKWKMELWPDLRKGVFHTHPIYQLRRFITLDWYKLLTWNLVSTKCQHGLMIGGSFSSICHSKTKLWHSKCRELDVCGRLLFANSVTIGKQKMETVKTWCKWMLGYNLWLMTTF